MNPSDRAARFQRALADLEARQSIEPAVNMFQSIALYGVGLVMVLSPLWARWIWGS